MVGLSGRYVLILPFLLLLLSVNIINAANNEAKWMVDDMSYYFEGTEYPPQRYQRILQCLSKWGDNDIITAQDASFRYFYKVWLAGGINNLENENENDYWGILDGYYESDQNKTAWMGSGSRTYEIQARCNYASNVAYYSTALRVCDYPHWSISEQEQAALMKTAVAINSASSWFHGSMTRTGVFYDNMAVSMLANNAYQILIQSIDSSTTTDPVFLTASDRDIVASDIVDMANDLVYMPLRQPPRQWRTYLEDNIEARVSTNYIMTSLCFIFFACLVSLSKDICECLVLDTIGSAAANNETLTFLREQYAPALEQVVADEGLPLPPWQGIPLFRKTMGATVALLWSVLFVEEGTSPPQMFGPIFNLTLLGQFSSPVVDFMLQCLTTIPETDRRTKEMYPGSKFCNRDSPHALWHELSAETIFEATAVADEINSILTKRKQKEKRGFMVTLAATFNSVRGAGR